MFVAATLQDQGADAIGYFTDGTVFEASNHGASLSVNVDNGTCLGTYYVSHCSFASFFLLHLLHNVKSCSLTLVLFRALLCCST